MVKKYRRLTDEEREHLIHLIHKEGYTIKDASRELSIPYPNAKAVNQTYLLENRTAKKSFRYRLGNAISNTSTTTTP
jgi:molybdenum-dependent DNA-binding transcriptional regulator ModE